MDSSSSSFIFATLVQVRYHVKSKGLINLITIPLKNNNNYVCFKLHYNILS